MRIGLGLSRGGAAPWLRQSDVVADFTHGPGPDGTYTLPPWLAYSVTSGGTAEWLSAQTSATSLRTGFAILAPRAYNAGQGWGLLVENAIVQRIANNLSWQGGQWLASSAELASGQLDPSGGNQALRLVGSSGQYSPYCYSVGSGPERMLSAWMRAESGAFRLRGYNEGGATAEVHYPPQWGLYSDPVETPGYAIVFCDEPGACSVFGAQIESNAYPSSLVPHLGSISSRPAGILTVRTLSALCPGGFVDCEIEAAPLYAHNQAGSDPDWLQIGPGCVLRFEHQTSTFRAVVDGAELVVGPVAFARNQPITVRLIHTLSSRMLRVSGCASGDGFATTGPGQGIALPELGYLLSNSSGATECASIRKVTFRRP